MHTSNHQIARYPFESLRQLHYDISQLHATRAPLFDLASKLMYAGIKADLARNAVLEISPRYEGVSRDFANARYYDHETLKGAPWADDVAEPLGKGEAWNAGRRATLTGIEYHLDDDNLPINPYQATGLRGRGSLGQFGPNHAVDNGVVMVKQDALSGEFTLHALGILRKHENDAPALAGGFAKFTRNENGEYTFDRGTQVMSQAEELFEEAVSGSVPLLDDYKPRVEAELAHEVSVRQAAGQSLSPARLAELREEVETAVKLEQVRALDPGFWQRFYLMVATSHECFAGPIMNDGRTTDNAWIESRLAWFFLDDERWEMVRGPNPRFDYRFEAGDDASGVVAHKIDAELIGKAYASHGALFLYLAASYVADSSMKGADIPEGVYRQLSELVNQLDTSQPSPSF